MAITEALVLPEDVILMAVTELPAQVRAQLTCEEGDYAITRPRARTPSSIVDAQAAALLEEFRTPTTIVEAVIAFSQARQTDPQQTLEEAFPMLQRFLNARLLVPAGSEEAHQITPCFDAGARIAGFTVLRCVQVLEDTELYHAQRDDGVEAALKILRPGYGNDLKRVYAREAAILQHLDDSASPALLEAGTFEERPYLAISWCPGTPGGEAAQERRRLPGAEGRMALWRLCGAVLEAYARLHAQGVIHSDVHPRNLLVAEDGTVKIIDYGVARLEDPASPYRRAQRAGIGFFFEPEYARACLEGHHPPLSTRQGELYALGSLLYYLLTGAYYVEFALEKKEMLRQIVEAPPLPFERRGARAWPAAEAVLSVALRKDPAERFASVAEMAARWREAAPPAVESLTLLPEPATPADLTPALQILDRVLERIGMDGPLLPTGLTSAPTCSVTNGGAGIAYALYRIAGIRDQAALLSLADIWATRSAHLCASDTAFYSPELEITPEVVGQAALYHAASGVHCVRALIGHAMSDLNTQQSALEAFLQTAQAPCPNPDVTLGRAGVLLGCALLLDVMPENNLIPAAPLQAFGNGLMQGIWQQVDADAPIPKCRDLTFMGIAHGWAGMLYAVLRWCQATGQAPPETVLTRLAQLAAFAEPAGRGVRWKRKLHARRQELAYDYWPGWCNGSAGFVHLWTLAHRTFGDPTYLTLAEKAAWTAWEDPDPMPDLCCGLGGRAYALLNLYRNTEQADWLYRAQALAGRAAQSITQAALRPDSLYKGEVGIALLAADLTRPEGACMPLFEAEGWS